MATYEPAGWCPKCGYRMEPGVCPECGTVVDRPLRRDPRVTRRRWYQRAVLFIACVGVAGLGWWNRDELAIRFWPTGHLIHLWENAQGEWRDWSTDILSARSSRLAASEFPGIESRTRLLEREIAGIQNHDWAGRYGRCNSPPWLVLAPNGEFGFENEVLGCFSTGPPTFFRNMGRIVEVTPERIRLEPRYDTRLGYFDCPVEFARVHWRGRHLLIPEDEMLYFCNQINSGQLMNAMSWAFGRYGEAGTRTSDLPKVPARFRECLLSAPILLKVSEIIAPFDPARDSTIARLVPNRPGIRVGMDIFDPQRPSHPDFWRIEGTVTAVSATDCIVEFDVYRRIDEANQPRVGWLFSTRDPDAEALEAQLDMIEYNEHPERWEGSESIFAAEDPNAATEDER